MAINRSWSNLTVNNWKLPFFAFQITMGIFNFILQGEVCKYLHDFVYLTTNEYLS